MPSDDPNAPLVCAHCMQPVPQLDGHEYVSAEIVLHAACARELDRRGAELRTQVAGLLDDEADVDTVLEPTPLEIDVREGR